MSQFQARKVRFVNKQKWLKRAEKYVREYRKKEQDQLRLARETKKAGNYYIAPEPRLAFVIRIRGFVSRYIVIGYFEDICDTNNLFFYYQYQSDSTES